MSILRPYAKTVELGAIMPNGAEVWVTATREEFEPVDRGDGHGFRPLLTAEQAGVLAACSIAGGVIVDDDSEPIEVDHCGDFIAWHDGMVSVDVSYHDSMMDKVLDDWRRAGRPRV